MHVIEFFTADWGEYCKQAETDIFKAIEQSGKEAEIKFTAYDINNDTYFDLLQRKFNKATKMESEDDPVIPFTIIDDKVVIVGYPEDMKERIMKLIK